MIEHGAKVTMFTLRKRLIFVLISVLFVISCSSDGNSRIEIDPPDFTWIHAFYVDSSAGGNNDGSSWENAWISFSDIDWDAVVPGDAIFISGGNKSKTYNETLNINKGGTADLPVYIAVGHVVGHHGTVIIDVADTEYYGVSFADSSCDNVVIDGSINGNISFKIQNALSAGISHSGAQGIKLKYLEVYHCGDPDSSPPSGYTEGIVMNGMSGCEIAYCDIWYNYQDAIRNSTTSGGFGSNLIHHNELHNNGDDGMQLHGDCDIYENTVYNNGMDGIYPKAHADGLQVHGSYVRVWNNTFYDNVNSSIYIDSLNDDQGNIRVFNNVLYQTREDSSSALIDDSAAYTRGIELAVDDGCSMVDDVVVAHNTIVDLTFTAISLRVRDAGQGFQNIKIYNNIISNCGKNCSSAILTNHANYSHTDVLIDYNLIYPGDKGKSGVCWQDVNYTYEGYVQALLGQQNGVSSDPLFATTDDGQYTLKFASPAVDSAMNLAVDDTYQINSDKAGVSRPKGNGCDIGAYESY